MLEVSIGKPAGNIGRDLGDRVAFGVMKDPGSDGKSGVPVPLGVVLVAELPLGVEPEGFSHHCGTVIDEGRNAENSWVVVDQDLAAAAGW